MPLADVIDNLVTVMAPQAVTGVFFQGWETAAPLRDYPLAQRTEINDTRICRLCRAVQGKVVRRTDPAYLAHRHQLHINCRGDWVWIHHTERDHRGRPTEADWPGLDDTWTDETTGKSYTYQQLIDQHGHFVADPKKYAALNIPPAANGRQVIFYRPKGQRHVVARWRESMPDWQVRDTLQRMSQGMQDPQNWSEPGDFSLGQQILRHAAYRGLLDGSGRVLAQARRLFPSAALTAQDLRSLMAVLADHTNTSYGPISGTEPRRWAIHSGHVTLPDGRTLDNVTFTYSPQTGAYVAVNRLSP